MCTYNNTNQKFSSRLKFDIIQEDARPRMHVCTFVLTYVRIKLKTLQFQSILITISPPSSNTHTQMLRTHVLYVRSIKNVQFNVSTYVQYIPCFGTNSFGVTWMSLGIVSVQPSFSHMAAKCCLTMKRIIVIMVIGKIVFYWLL